MKKAMAVLLMCLCLSACAAPAETDGILGQASGLDEDETLLTVDSREVPSWRYLYWLSYGKSAQPDKQILVIVLDSVYLYVGNSESPWCAAIVNDGVYLTLHLLCRYIENGYRQYI